MGEFAVVLLGYEETQRLSALHAVREYVPGSLGASVALLEAAAADPAGRIIATRIPATHIAAVVEHLMAAGAAVQRMDTSFTGAASPAQRRERYEAAVFAALHVPAALPWVPQGGIYRALFQPSFHAYTCLTLHVDAENGLIEIVVARQDLAHSLWPVVGGRGPGAAVAHETLLEVPVAALQPVRTAFRRWSSGAWAETGDGIGIDGIPIRVDVRAGKTRDTVHLWSPSATRQPAQYQLCRMILEVAQAARLSAPYQKALQDIEQYLK